jgi:hypothetical protein
MIVDDADLLISQSEHTGDQYILQFDFLSFMPPIGIHQAKYGPHPEVFTQKAL